jgi:hypothetical protein
MKNFLHCVQNLIRQPIIGFQSRNRNGILPRLDGGIVGLCLLALVLVAQNGRFSMATTDSLDWHCRC